MAFAKSTHSIQAEQGLLGAIIINNDALTHCAGLDGEHFYEPLHTDIYEACRQLVAKGGRATPTTIMSFMPNLTIGDMTGGQYLARLCAEAITIINASDYAKMIVDYAVKRDIIQAARDYATDENTPPAEANKKILDVLDAIRLGMLQREGRQTQISAAVAAGGFVEYLAQVMGGTETSGAIPTKVGDFDEQLSGGFMPGCLYIGAGRPGMGKSTVAASMARQVAQGGTGAYYFSFEMPERQMASRMLADHTLSKRDRVVYSKMMRGTIKDFQAEQVVNAARDIRDWSEHGLPLEFDFSTRMTTGMIAARVRRMKALMKKKYNTDLGLVVLDYLKFIEASNRYQGNRVLEVGEITRALKELALSEQVAVFLLVQLNRKVEERSEKIPVLSDLRESGEIEQDADVVLFFYREAYYLEIDPKLNENPVLQDKLGQCVNKLQIIIGKNRHGPVGTIHLYCDMGTASVRTDYSDFPSGNTPYYAKGEGMEDKLFKAEQVRKEEEAAEVPPI